MDYYFLQKSIAGVPFYLSLIDYDKDNLDPNNLISLCNSCHAKTNKNRDYWINLFNK